MRPLTFPFLLTSLLACTGDDSQPSLKFTPDSGSTDASIRSGRDATRRDGPAVTDAATHDGGAPPGDAQESEPDAAADVATCSLGATDAALARFDASAPPPGDRLFFIGNSFTYTNDLPGTLASMVKEWSSSPPPYVASFTVGGSTLAQDLSDLDASGVDAGPRLLIAAPDGGQPLWTDVMLQEQSEIPGFLLSDEERIESMNASVKLAGLAVRAHAIPVVVMTWGYRSGDPNNPPYTDFLTMQALLDTGFRQMEHAITLGGYPVRIAPMGPAFQAVYESDEAAGRSPTAAGSTFDSLYESDGKHPAPAATYLQALVLMSTLYGVDPTTICANPKALPLESQRTLAQAARRAVLAERAYPEGGDAGSFDAGEGGLLCGPCPSCGAAGPSCCGPVSPCPP